jgi:hypothetical protein
MRLFFFFFSSSSSTVSNSLLFLYFFMALTKFVSLHNVTNLRNKTLQLMIRDQLAIYFKYMHPQIFPYLIYLLHGAGHYLKSWLSLSLSKNILFYRSRRFITVFTKTHHWTLSRASRIQFAPSIPVSLKNVKVKLSFCLTKHHPMKAYWGSGDIAPRILWLRH